MKRPFGEDPEVRLEELEQALKSQEQLIDVLLKAVNAANSTVAKLDDAENEEVTTETQAAQLLCGKTALRYGLQENES